MARRPAWNRRSIDVDWLRREYERGVRVTELAAQSGVTIYTVYRRLRAVTRIRTNAAAHRGLQVAEQNPHWAGGRYVGSNGYVWLRVAPGRYRLEHRVIAEQHLGRPLGRREVVHHRNGNRTDNRWENLEVIASHADHMRDHLSANVARERGRRGGLRRQAQRRAALAPQGDTEG